MNCMSLCVPTKKKEIIFLEKCAENKINLWLEKKKKIERKFYLFKWKDQLCGLLWRPKWSFLFTKKKTKKKKKEIKRKRKRKHKVKPQKERNKKKKDLNVTVPWMQNSNGATTPTIT